MNGYTQRDIPPIVKCTKVLSGDDTKTIYSDLNESVPDGKHHANDRNYKIVWHNVIVIGAFHLGAIYGLYLSFTSTKCYTIIFGFIIGYSSGIGITAGAHRLWSHRCYKAKLPLQILLLIFQTMAFEYSIFRWARDHRAHHKYSDTNADPLNPTRGFFFAHVGWMLCHKHPDAIAKDKEIDISDLENNPLLHFQNKYYNILVLIACFIMPTLIPVYLWNETIKNAWFTAVMLRWTATSNTIWSVNSFAHKYGNHPYDRFIKPADNLSLTIVTLGEGWHNYHHTFPWDYKSSEFGNNNRTNFTKLFIDCMAKIGWAYDLKTTSPEMIKRRIKRTGDGTHQTFGGSNEHTNDIGKICYQSLFDK